MLCFQYRIKQLTKGNEMNNITYLKLKNLETGNRILNVCNKNMEEINEKLLPEIFKRIDEILTPNKKGE